MPDLKKVIKGLELCLGSIDSAGCPEECPYYEACQKYENYAVFQPLMRDALEALKTFHKPVFMVGSKRCAGLKYAIEQETKKAGGQPLLIMCDVEPVPVEITDGDGGRTKWYVCGACKAPINPGDKYCHECGKAVKWDADAAD